jgi:ABC-type lipoprotein export system ATPase subunit
MVCLTEIVKSYGDGDNRLNRVLVALELKVSRGEFVAVRGVSGSGKTTLLNILGTLTKPDGGQYFFDGREVTAPGFDCARFRNEQTGFVFQNHRLMPQYSVMENILLPVLAFRRRVDAAYREYAGQLTEMLGIAALAGRSPHTLSGGEAGRTALCRALIMKPSMILADEPTAQLDAENARSIATLLRKVNRDMGTTVIMATHSDEVSAVADRVLRLNNGRLS